MMSNKAATVQSYPVLWNSDHPRMYYVYCPRCREEGVGHLTYKTARDERDAHACAEDNAPPGPIKRRCRHRDAPRGQRQTVVLSVLRLPTGEL
jgi:hypothetical protein